MAAADRSYLPANCTKIAEEKVSKRKSATVPYSARISRDTKSAPAVIPGRMVGKVVCQNVCQGVRPNIREASSKDAFKDRKAEPLRRNT